MALCRHFSPAYWISSEQTGPQVGLTLGRVAPGCRIEVKILRGPKDLLPYIRTLKNGLVVLDSITALAGWSEQTALLEEIREWIKGGQRRFIGIQQVNAQSKGAGEVAIQHLVDATVFIDNGRIVVDKNRAGPIGAMYFSNDEKGVSLPDFRFAYSVEGERGDYRLHPFPVEGAKYAGIFKEMLKAEEEIDLSGLASAAIPCTGYPGGFYRPEDTAARQRFAEVHHLRWV